jgi:hypothetical protein
MNGNPHFVLQNFIDIELWNRARWLGVAWIYPPRMPPSMGLLFMDNDLGAEIFSQWQARIGKVDEYEQLRISIIEGSIPGAKPGYNVRIATNIPNVVQVAAENGIADPNVALVAASRVHRMHPPKASKNLAAFKRAYEEHKNYSVFQAVRDTTPSGFKPIYSTAITKSEIFFRQVESIGKGDLDSDALVDPSG